MFLVAGLGNHEKEYTATRHNAGFMLIDKLAEYFDFPDFSKKKSYTYSKGKIGVNDVILLKPATYMNNSGIALHSAASFWKIPISNIIILHDEIDIPLTQVKIKTGGGNAGHNGLKSLDSYITRDYTRVRIGIGRGREEVSDYVLSNFSKAEKGKLDVILQNLAEDFPKIMDATVSSFNFDLGKIDS